MNRLRSILFCVLFCLSVISIASSETSWYKDYTLIITGNTDTRSTHQTRNYIVSHGGKIAVVVPPHVMLGWIPETLATKLVGHEKIELVSSHPVNIAAIPYRDEKTLAMVTFFNKVVTGQLEMEEEVASQVHGEPLSGDGFDHPNIDKEAYKENLNRLGIELSPEGNSDNMTGTAAICMFFVESNGSIDADSYTWSTTDENDTISRATSGLSWWSSQAPSYGSDITYYLSWYSHTDPNAQQGYEPIIHPSSDDDLWINAIMTNLGYTAGDKFARVTAFNTTLKGNEGTDWAYSAFVGYNPPGAPTTFTDGYFAYAWLGGPFTQLLFNNDGWGASNFGLVLTHETGHIFWACDEYYQEGYGGCTDCGACATDGPRPWALNANCEFCNPSSVNCMMKNNTHALCIYTPDQIGWLSTSCTYADGSLQNGVTVNDSINCSTSQGAWKYYSFTVASGSSNLVTDLNNLTADANLYVRFGAKPDLTNYDCRPYQSGTTSEQCNFASPAAGVWWVGINNYDIGAISYSVSAAWSEFTCIFCDDFADGVLNPNWTYIKNISDWSESNDALSGSSTRKTEAHAIPAFSGCTACYGETIMRSAGGPFNRVWFLFHVQDKNNLVELMMDEGRDRWVLKHRINKRVVAKQKFASTIDANTDYTVRVRYDGTNFIATINGVDQITMAPGGSVTGGSVGFKVKATTGTFQRIEVN
jgi:hypothetical protein